MGQEKTETSRSGARKVNLYNNHERRRIRGQESDFNQPVLFFSYFVQEGNIHPAPIEDPSKPSGWEMWTSNSNSRVQLCVHRSTSNCGNRTPSCYSVLTSKRGKKGSIEATIEGRNLGEYKGDPIRNKRNSAEANKRRNEHGPTSPWYVLCSACRHSATYASCPCSCASCPSTCAACARAPSSWARAPPSSATCCSWAVSSAHWRHSMRRSRDRVVLGVLRGLGLA